VLYCDRTGLLDGDIHDHDGNHGDSQLLMLAHVHGFQLRAALRAVAEGGARFGYPDAPDSHVGAVSNLPEAQGATAMRDVPRCAPSSTDDQALALSQREAAGMGVRVSCLRAISNSTPC
jgi:hypothetical protein